MTDISGARLGIVCAASDAGKLQRCLLASPALRKVYLPMVVVYGAPNAALSSIQRTLPASALIGGSGCIRT